LNLRHSFLFDKSPPWLPSREPRRPEGPPGKRIRKGKAPRRKDRQSRKLCVGIFTRELFSSGVTGKALWHADVIVADGEISNFARASRIGPVKMSPEMRLFL